MANDLEDALAGMGFNLSDNPEELENTEQTTEETTESSEPIEEATEEGQPEQTDVLTNEENNVDAELDSILSEETVETAPQEETISQEDYESTVLQAVSEMLGSEFSSVDDLKGLLNNEQPTQVELDPEVEAIAKFVKETGRSAQDWFSYQSFNPSEMDDITVMTTSIQQEFPDISKEDAKIILSERYKLDEDMYSENEAKVGGLNLKMDAQRARTQLEEVRNSYKAPARQEQTTEPEEIESPITQEWISSMSETVSDIESLELEIGQDKSFTFGLRDDYKSTLIEKNSKLDEFFDQYVDDSGDWDFDSLSAHRAIVDNIDEIAKSIYAQGLADGKSDIVKEAVNPSSPAPQGASVDAASAQDKVRQQVLDALRGGDDRLRIKF